MDPIEKICRICGVTKPESEFLVRSDSGIKRTECKDCLHSLDNKRYEQAKLIPKITLSSKVCSKCHEEKSVTDFQKNPGKKDGLVNQCKDCTSQYYKSKTIKTYLSKRKESGKQKETLDRYRQSHREEINRRHRDRRKASKNLDRVNYTVHRLELRRKAIDKLGGKCVICGEDNILKLCIDHINDDGNEERKKFGFRTIVSKILNNIAEENKYQALCFNCNRKKQLSKLKNERYKSLESDETKLCTKCLKLLSIDQFHGDRYKSTKSKSHCKSCVHNYQLKRKQKVMSLFGCKCAKCGETDIDVLEIDHINNDGANKRKSGEDKDIYLKLASGKRNTDGLQLLCANCNFEKAYYTANRSKNDTEVISDCQVLIIDPSQIKLQLSTSSYFKEFLEKFHPSGIGKTHKAIYEILFNDNVIGILKFSIVTKQEILTSSKSPIHKILELDRFCIKPEYYSYKLYKHVLSEIGNLIRKDFPSIEVLVSFVNNQTDNEIAYEQSGWQTLTNYNTIMNQQAIKLNMNEQKYAEFLRLAGIQVSNAKWYIYKL
jgi:hypothetical protein